MADNLPKKWHALSVEDTLKFLGSDDKKGLSFKEAKKRFKTFGENTLEKKKEISKVALFLRQFKSPLIYVLLIASLINILLKELTDAFVIFLVVFINALIGFIQEQKASQAFRVLRKALTYRTFVIREGKEVEIDVKEVVPGDIIVLVAGQKVPADARIIESKGLKVNEASLTGEWLPVSKTSHTLPDDTPLAERTNMVYMGTFIEDGSGKAVVTETGSLTEVGKISLALQEEEERTPLQKKISNFGKLISLALVGIVFFIFLAGILNGRGFEEMFTISVAVAVAAIPEAMPVAITIILALGMQNILKKKGLVRRLLAAETLGSTSVVCTDKTLTLTQGKMVVGETITASSKIGKDEEKNWQDNFLKKKNSEQLKLLTIAGLVNEAFVENPEDSFSKWRLRGRPTDKAMLLAAAQVGLGKPALEKDYQQIDLLSFSSENKLLAKLFKKGRDIILFVAGSPEKILSLSAAYFQSGEAKTLNKEVKDYFVKEIERLTSKSFRVVAIAYKEYSRIPSYNSLLELCQQLIFVGLLAFYDPLRPDAKEAIKTLKEAGVRPIMVTGDHLLTAKAVAEAVGISVKEDNYIEGKQLDKMSEEEFEKLAPHLDIYARVEPRHKMKIVNFWQEKGEIVAMTGDGVNDAPALKRADIGIALGSGTDVAKEASDLILLNDSFVTFEAAIAEGRRIMDNIRKTLTFLISDSFAEMVLIASSIFLGLPLPVTPIQILWVNLIEGGLPAISLAFEKQEKDVMKHPPEKSKSLITAEMRAIIFIIGLFTSLIVLGVFLWYWFKGADLEFLRTMIFALLGTNSLFYVFACKSLRHNIWQIDIFSNRFLIFSVLIGIVIMLGSIYLPPLQFLLKTVPLSFQQLMFVFAYAFLNVVLIEIVKYYYIRVARK